MRAKGFGWQRLGKGRLQWCLWLETLCVLLGISWLNVLGAESSVSQKPENLCRMRMLWLPQTEFAGFYVAKADGLYEQAGVKMELDHPNPEDDIFDSLLDGAVDIIVGWPLPALSKVCQGADLVNMGQIAQKSGLMMIARKSSGIVHPADISGHRVGLWMAPTLKLTAHVFLDHYKIKDCTFLPVMTNVDLFLYGGVDITIGVYYDEYYRIYGAGINPEELVVFYLNDTFPELVDDGLYCKGTVYQKNPERYNQIREASLEGWRRAFAQPERAFALTEQECVKAGIHFNIAHQRWMLRVMQKLVFPEGETNTGVLTPKSFEEAMQILNLDSKAVQYEQFVPAGKK